MLWESLGKQITPEESDGELLLSKLLDQQEMFGGNHKTL